MMSDKDEAAKQSQLYWLGAKTRKADTELVVQDILLPEDEFANDYWDLKGNAQNQIMRPPYPLRYLKQLSYQNNILSQCIEAMVVNIDGTGWSVQPVEETTDAIDNNEDQKKQLESLFSEPWPDQSFVTMRRSLRYDLESTGNGYLEVIKNLDGEVIMLRHLDSTIMRLVRLDEPVQVEEEIVRNGQIQKATIWKRERRYAQKIGQQTVFYRSANSSREVCAETGRWLSDDQLDNHRLGSEVIHFTVHMDATSPYGIPRWINQLPSVLGSRKAEEFNLDFFDTGGIPPAVVFIEGGGLSQDVHDQLDQFFAGQAKSRHRVPIVQVQSTGGDVNNPGRVAVKMERFGEQKADSMFQQYDKNTEEHVRVAFRLPPMFIGRAQDYNFATAMTGYMVTEAQVFSPERQEFDEIINLQVTRSLNIDKWKITSNPLTITNTEVQMKGLELAAPVVDQEEWVTNLNRIASLNLKFDSDLDVGVADPAVEQQQEDLQQQEIETDEQYADLINEVEYMLAGDKEANDNTITKVAKQYLLGDNNTSIVGCDCPDEPS